MSEQNAQTQEQSGESTSLSTVEKVRIYTEMANGGSTNAEIAKRLNTKPESLSVWASNMRKRLKGKGVDLPHPKSARGKGNLDELAGVVRSITGQLDEAEKSGESEESESQDGDGVTLESGENEEAEVETEAEAKA